MTSIGSYHVPVKTLATGIELALVTPAALDDLPTDWAFDWPGLWRATDFECQNIVKLAYESQVWGLVRYGLYCYPGPPSFLEIEQLESNPGNQGEATNRLIEPVGKWLIWYATQVGLRFCSGNDTLISLVSLEKAVAYYRDKVRMKYLGPTRISPDEDGYAFKFSCTEAEEFCWNQQFECGIPISFF